MSPHRRHRKRGPIGPQDYAVEDRGYGSPCWVWVNMVANYGYGGIRRKGKLCRAHRVMYEQTNAVCVPSTTALHHLCGVRLCIRPDHLEPMTMSAHTRLHHPRLKPLPPAPVRPPMMALVEFAEARAGMRELKTRLDTLIARDTV